MPQEVGDVCAAAGCTGYTLTLKRPDCGRLRDLLEVLQDASTKRASIMRYHHRLPSKKNTALQTQHGIHPIAQKVRFWSYSVHWRSTRKTLLESLRATVQDTKCIKMHMCQDSANISWTNTGILNGSGLRKQGPLTQLQLATKKKPGKAPLP